MINNTGKLIKIAAVVVFPFIIFVVLDISLGLILLKRDEIRLPHPYFHHTLKLMAESAAKWGDLVYTIKTNSLGFKDENKNIIAKNLKLKKRLVIIGDSFTEGLGYDFKDTFCGIIKDSLKDSVEVLNAGLTSYSPKLYFLKTDYLLKNGFHFEKLLVMLDLSDIQDEVIYEDFEPSVKFGVFRNADMFLQNYSFTYNKLLRVMIKKIFLGQNSLNSESQLETKMTDRASWTYNKESFNNWGSIGLKYASDYMLKLKSLCDENGIRLYLAVYPWPETLRNDSSESKQTKFWSSFCAYNNVDFIDLFPYFFTSGETDEVIRKYYIHGDDHWNAEGHKFIAKKLLEKIK